MSEQNEQSGLINEVAAYVTDLFNHNTQSYLLYHNLEHTKFVIGKAEEIGYHYSLTSNEMSILVIAAWFHDTGQLFNYGKNHEIKSVALMKEFFSKKEIGYSTINVIEKCILATKMPHHPNSLLEEIICDADTYNLGTEDFPVTDDLLKKECEIKEHKKIYDWNTNTLKFLEYHKYFTSYCQQLLNGRKQENINIFSSKLH